MQIIENRGLLFEHDDPEHVCSTVAKTAPAGGSEVLAYWDYPTSSALAQMGLDVPSPMLRDYGWPGRHVPFGHQKVTSSFLSLRKKAFCFNEQGLGKTKSVIWAADYLMNIGEVSRVLVVSPLSIMKTAWQADLFDAAMHRTCSVAYGTSARRKKILGDGAEFVIINYDGVETIYDAIAAGGFDLVVSDEGSYLKNNGTNRWKTMNKLLDTTGARFWLLTGTPAAQSPLDAFGLAKLINPLGCPRSKTRFRDRVLTQVSRYKWEPKSDSAEYVHKVLQPAIRFEKKDCLDLPPMTYLERTVELTPMQKKYYTRLKDQMLVEAAGETISAANAAVKLQKLLQVSCGSSYTDEGEVIDFDVSNRIKVVLEAVAESPHKVLIFVPYKHTIELLREALEKHGYSVGVINGDVSLNKRTKLVEDFQAKDKPEVLLIQPQAASHGLTLTAADTVIWYAPVTSVETYLQANARIDRPGQKHPMTVIHIRGSEVESHLYRMLRDRMDEHGKLISLYRDVIGGNV